MKIPLPGIRYFTSQNQSTLKNLAEFFYFLYQRNRWMFDLSGYLKDFENVKISKPIFVLGLEGGGLTLVTRMLRRNKNMVGVSGNYKNWAGPDEMQLVLGPILSPEFTGRRHNLPEKLKKLNVPGNKLYAADEFIDYYRNEAKDVTPQLRENFRKIIRWLIARSGANMDKARFIDKSQGFTVKVSFINKILEDTNPKFLLITRDPYATAYKFAHANVKNYTDKIGAGEEKALRISSQHWKNSMKYALEDAEEVGNFLTVKFEDILTEPERNVRKICEFVEIDFDQDLLPQPGHKAPFGSKGKEKWYPLRPGVNQKYFQKMTQETVEIIEEELGGLARKLRYEQPELSSYD